MPKQDHSRDRLSHLDAKISSIRQQCYQLRAEREFMQVRLHDLARDVDALVRHYARPQELKMRPGLDARSPAFPEFARRNSASLHNLDCLKESLVLTRSSLSIDETILRQGQPPAKESGPPSCPPLTRSLQSSPVAKGHRKRVTPLDSSSHLKADTARNRSNSQQSLPDSISRDRDTASRGSLVRAKSGDVRAASKMSLSSSSPALACKDSPGHALLLGQRQGDRIDHLVSLLTSKTCTDL